MGKEDLTDGANWTPEMHSRFQTLTDNEGMPMDRARAIVLREAGVRVSTGRPAAETGEPGSEVESEITDAAHRVVPDESEEPEEDVPQPAAPAPGESDRDIQQRHRDAVRSREPDLDESDAGPRTLPPEVQAYRDKLRRGDDGSTDEGA